MARMATERLFTSSLSREKGIGNHIPAISHAKLKTFDVALALVASQVEDSNLFTPQESKRLLRKLDWHLLPLLCLVFTVQYIDKSTLSSSSILGLIADNHLSTSEFNTLASAFYIGYLVFVWPQSWALQRFPVGKWLSFNIFLWCLFIGLHPLCHDFAGLFILRFLLGASEGCMYAGLMLVCGMFYTRGEVSERIGWSYQCNGVAVIISGFMQFGLAHISPKAHPNQWRWLMIITALLTVIPLIGFLLIFPDNPTTARFLTPEERILAVKRVRENQNGIETKVWKRYQFIEALLDVKTWLYFVLAAFGTLTGGIAVQYALIIKSFGFTLLQTTLLGIPNGLAIVVSITFACYLVKLFPVSATHCYVWLSLLQEAAGSSDDQQNSRAWISIISWTPSIIACLIQILVPFNHKVVHLVGIYLTSLGTTPSLIISMSWVVSNTSGHTKKMTTIAVSLVGNSLGNTLGPQFWLDKYKPENRVPWGLVLMANLASIICTYGLRYMFARENRRRNDARAEALRSGVGLQKFEGFVVMKTYGSDGIEVEKKVDKMYLDLTDGENLAFRYVL